ncbi:MAG: hypothetical protein JXA04_11335 [Gammaproteobacteria bacterium]|nr:hypothetical protein [Gammaproteobacteria bacterium]
MLNAIISKISFQKPSFFAIGDRLNGIRKRIILFAILLFPVLSHAGVTTTINAPSSDSDGSFTVAWTVTATGTIAGGYTRLQQRLNGGAWGDVVQKNLGSQSHTVTVTNSGTYDYRVFYYYVQIVALPYYPYAQQTPYFGYSSTDTTVVTLAPTSPPSSAPTITLAGTDSDGGYSLSWNSVSGASSYTWQERENSGSWGTETSTNSTSLSRSKSNGTYGYHVKACNSVGCSTYSSEASIIVAITPGVPSSISVGPNPSAGDIEVSWGSASGTVTRYELEQQKNGGGWINIYNGTALSQAISVSTDGSYAYRVRACNVVSTYTNCTGWRTSSAITVVVPAMLTVPTSDTDGDGTFTLSWSGGHTYIQIFEDGVAIHNSGDASGSISVTRESGTYSYQIKDCSVVGGTPPTYNCVMGPVNQIDVVANAAPTISSIGNITIDEGGSTGTIAFTVGDVETAATSLTVTASSSGVSVIQTGDIVLGGTGSSRTLSAQADPVGYGTVTITVTVSDGQRNSSETFTITINNISARLNVPATDNDGDGTYTISWWAGYYRVRIWEKIPSGDWVNISEGEQQTTSSWGSKQITHLQNGTYEYKIEDCSLYYPPSGGYSFNCTYSQQASIVVSGINLTAPTISNINNLTINEGDSTGPITFTVSDAETPATSLVVSASSSDISLIPNNNITLSGSGSSRTITAQAAPTGSGPVTVTVTVTDDSPQPRSSSDTFVVTIAPNGTISYEYDELGRVIKVIHPNSVVNDYEYDNADNRTSKSSSTNN